MLFWWRGGGGPNKDQSSARMFKTKELKWIFLFLVYEIISRTKAKRLKCVLFCWFSADFLDKKQTIHSQLGRMLGCSGLIHCNTFEYTTMHSFHAIYIQWTGALIEFNDGNAIFTGYNRRWIQHPTNVNWQIAFICHTLNSDTVASIRWLITKQKWHDLRCNYIWRMKNYVTQRQKKTTKWKTTISSARGRFFFFFLGVAKGDCVNRSIKFHWRIWDWMVKLIRLTD